MSIVLDSNFVEKNVIAIPSTITQVRITAESKEGKKPHAVPTKNIEIIAISVGNLPLQGTKLFVSIARSFSRGESIILQPTIPAALQPKPMHMVSACLPHALHILKGLSRLYGILGR